MINSGNMDALLNDFAFRCFRDTADQDYIMARMAYRARLIPQFHWSGLHAIEKYFKTILLLNRVQAKKVSHNLSKALQLTKQLTFKIKLSQSSEEIINHLDKFGRHRYLEGSYYIYGPKLVGLDKAVWEIRRFCQVLNYEIEIEKGKKKNLLQEENERINRSEDIAPHKFRLLGGALEKIVDNKEHPARPPLIWQNAFFGLSSRKKVKVPVHFQATNAPLTLHPEILDEVKKYVHLPDEVVKEYQAGLKKTNQ